MISRIRRSFGLREAGARTGELRLARAVAVTLVLARVAAAADFRVVTWNVENGVGAPGTAAFQAVQETMERLQPDVIALQEVDAQHPMTSHGSHFADVRRVLSALGFPTTRAHMATAGDGFEAQSFVAGDFGNSSQSLVIASRHPIRRTIQIGRGESSRREMTRFPLGVVLEVAGATRDVVVVAVHMKQGDTQADEFRRAVEAWRIREFLAADGISGDSHHLFVVGDMNEQLNDPQTASFSTHEVLGGHRFSDGSRLPVNFLLGAAIPDPLPYAGFPASAFAAAGVSIVAATQTDGVSDRTYTWAGDARLDYILTGSATRTAGSVRAEVYHSGREPVGDGQPKSPSLPSATLSLQASDHLPVIADVVLAPQPELMVTVLPGRHPVEFDARVLASPGRVTIPEPRATPLTVSIGPFRAAPVGPIDPVVIPAGETSATFPIVIEGSPFAHDRRVTLVATAEGYRDGLAVLTTAGTGVSGPLLISQYTETPSGSAPKAIEIMNISSRELNFAAEPLEVFSFASGATTGTLEVRTEVARLPAGHVLVIGDTATGQYLVSQQRLAATATTVANAPTGTVFTDSGRPDGRVVFIKRGFRFNGDDALEVRLNARRCDVFGTIGHDPGAAWSGAGVSTANQNLSRRPTATTSSSGWTDPSHVFTTTGTTHADALIGFGLPPLLNHPFTDWAATRGLAGTAAALHADPEGDGLPNGVDFVFGQAAHSALTSSASAPNQRYWHLVAPIRSHLGPLRWGVATTTDGTHWTTVWEATGHLSPPAPTFLPLSLTRPATPSPEGFARLFVIEP